MIALATPNPFPESPPHRMSIPARRPAWVSPPGTALRALVDAFIDSHGYKRKDGCLTPLFAFTKKLITSLDDPALQNYLCQQRRIRRILADLGFIVAAWQPTKDCHAEIMIANLSGGRRAASSVRLILEPNQNGTFLVPEDSWIGQDE